MVWELDFASSQLEALKVELLFVKVQSNYDAYMYAYMLGCWNTCASWYHVANALRNVVL